MTKAYSADGNEITAFIDTDIEDVSVDSLMKFGLKNYSYTLSIGGSGSARRSNGEILRHSRRCFIAGGEFNEDRQCYYPKGDSPQEVAERNKINKLFQKWGFKSL